MALPRGNMCFQVVNDLKERTLLLNSKAIKERQMETIKTMRHTILLIILFGKCFVLEDGRNFVNHFPFSDQTHSFSGDFF